MKKDKLVSIVIPVYNVLEELPKFLDIVLGSTYSNIELIAVDNNSKDDSLKLLKQRAKKDKRLRVFTEAKQGPGNARRTGFLKAKGEYIIFLDSDDYPSAETVQDYVDAFEKGADAVIGNYVETYEGGERLRFGAGDKLKSLDNLRLDPSLFLVKPALWNKAFKRQLITKEDFIDSWIGEDAALCLAALYRAKRVIYIDKTVYTYNLSDGGLSQSVNPEKLITIIDSTKAFKKVLKDNPEEGDFLAYSHLLYRMFRSVLIENKTKKQEAYENLLKEIRKIDIKDNKYYLNNKAYSLASFVLLNEKRYNNSIISFVLKKVQTNKLSFNLIKKFDK